ncbi:MAG: hypothetical protein PQJ48_05375 [Sphaerochaetaceae bacterium]|nr:hypothetical protein [Sphaerochaetaceae bacterium]
MGVKSYVAGLKADAQASALDTGMNFLGGIASLAKYDQALDQAKDKADITRETTGIEGLNEEFLYNLQYDRDYDSYQEKIDAYFADIEMQLDENELLSDEAKRTIRDEYIPVYKEQISTNAGILRTKGKMAEIEVEVEGLGSALASDSSLDYAQTLKGYKDHLEELQIFNEATVGKMVDEYAYSIAPVKGMQVVQKSYMDHYADDSFSLTESIDQVASELGLDASQKKEMKKQVSSWKTEYDRQMDTMYASQLDEVNAGIAQAYDDGEIFDVSMLDGMMEALPAKHRLGVYKAKKDAYANNDKLLEASILSIADESRMPTEAEWKQVELVHDPEKRDELGSTLLVGYGESLVSSGKSLSEAREAIQGYDGPVSARTRTKALAMFTKAQLDLESDVTKVAKDMLANTGDRIDTIARIPQDTLTDAMETAKPEAPAIDASQLGERGEEYIEEHISEVAEVIAPKISIGLGLPGISVDGLGDRGVPSSPEVAREVARMIVEEQVDAVPHEGVEKPLEGQEAEPEPESELTWEEPWWYSQYSEKRAERRKEIEEERAAYEARLVKQAESVRKEAGVVDAPKESGAYSRPLLERGMTQEALVSNMLQIIKDGEGKYLTQEELALIRNDDIREQMIEMASTKDSFLVDSPLALSFIDSLRRDQNVSSDSLRQAVEGFVNNGLIKAETAQDKRLTQKYAFAENPKEADLQTYIGKIADEVFPVKKGEVYNSNRDRLRTTLNDSANKAIAMNPELLGSDFSKLQAQLQTFAVNNLAKNSLDDLEKVTDLMANGDISKRITNLEHSTVSTFLQDVQAGDYDVLINYDVVQQPEIRSLRNADKTIVQDALSRKLTPYKDYQELLDNGTRFEQLKVMANVSFLMAGGALEKALTGSFGIKPSDMKVMGKNWAFSDPKAEGLYFIATDADAEKRGTLGWGMATADSDGVHNLVMFADYVDPQLTYEIEALKKQAGDPMFDSRKQQADRNRDSASSVLGLGGLGISPVKVQEELDDKYYGVLDELEAKQNELKTLTDDIMAYRYNLMGMPANTLRKRL